MVYTIFYFVGLIYNIWKFSREREEIKSALQDSSNIDEQLGILKHQFYVFVFECFFGVIAAMLVEDKHEDAVIAFILFIFLGITFISFGVFQFYLSYLKKWSGFDLKSEFNDFIVKDFRIVFSLILLPILSYSLISWAFSNGLKEWGNWWIIGAPIEVIFYSVMTIIFTVVAMLKLIPNREIIEPEYLELITPHLEKLGLKNMRLRWIDAKMKNAFVVGLNLWKFNNQTMFVGKPLRDILTKKEFEAVICHELAHIANNHIHKRVLALVKGFVLVIAALIIDIVVVCFVAALIFNEEFGNYGSSIGVVASIGALVIIITNQLLIFEEIRRHEYEADAFAVLELGAGVDDLENALKKLTEQKDVSTYIQKKTQVKENRFRDFVMKYFSNHPTLENRMMMVRKKLQYNLKFDWYESSLSKIFDRVRSFTSWKTVTPLVAMSLMLFSWVGFQYQDSTRVWGLIKTSSSEEIKNNPEILEKMHRPRYGIWGATMLAAITSKGDADLIDYFISKGARIDRVLTYLASQKTEMFIPYYKKYESQINQEQYYHILRLSAQFNTESYRYLVQDYRFNDLDSKDRKDINFIREYTQKDRAPASVKPTDK